MNPQKVHLASTSSEAISTKPFTIKCLEKYVNYSYLHYHLEVEASWVIC